MTYANYCNLSLFSDFKSDDFDLIENVDNKYNSSLSTAENYIRFMDDFYSDSKIWVKKNIGLRSKIYDSKEMAWNNFSAQTEKHYGYMLENLRIASVKRDLILKSSIDSI